MAKKLQHGIYTFKPKTQLVKAMMAYKNSLGEDDNDKEIITTTKMYLILIEKDIKKAQIYKRINNLIGVNRITKGVTCCMHCKLKLAYSIGGAALLNDLCGDPKVTVKIFEEAKGWER